ncbi:MAG: hypothetical protein ACNA7V_10655 [Bacteroidales bacterium]
MNITKKMITALTVITAALILMVGNGCSKDDDSSPTPEPARKTSYDLLVKDVLGVTGTVTFIETSATSTTIDIVLVGAPVGTHPAELCMNSAIEGGAVIVNLNPVDETGKSSTVVSTMSYPELIEYDGFIQVKKSTNEPYIILVQGDIGGNVITTTNITYVLHPIDLFGVSGTALFEKRINGNTLVTVTLTGVISGEIYPSSINVGSITTVGGGPVVVMLNSVEGNTGNSYTNIRKLDNGTIIMYDNWLLYQGYVNIYQTTVNINNIICHGNIGSN